MLSFEQFLDAVNKEYDSKTFNSRYGQTIMNVLRKIWPEKYYEITNVEYDCFYDDGIVSKTLNKLQKEWITYEQSIK